MAKKKPAKKKTKTAKKSAQPKTLYDFYNQIARKADTEGLKLNAAQTKRVLACFFDVLEDCPPADAFDFVAKGLKRAGQRRR